jgi:hypothetical protein
MAGLLSRFLSAVVLAGLVLIPLGAQQAPKAPPKSPLLRLVEPWPEAAQMRQRRLDAENLRLFAAEEPLSIRLIADFKTINKDRDPNSKKRYPAELKIDENGTTRSFTVGLNARGHLRRMRRTCDYVPLRIDFSGADRRGTIFQGQDAMKLIVQCRGAGSFEQYVLREYLAYKVFNAITPNSFRARLVKTTYSDFGGQQMGTRYAILLEEDSDVAKRMEGRVVDLPRATFKDLHADTLDTMMLFEYMVGNTDFSIYALHNAVLVQKPDRGLYPVPYDLDISGLVSPPYGIPDPRLPIKSVEERLYRGPCRPPEQADAAMARFTAVKDTILALPETVNDLDRGSRDHTKRFLTDFYQKLDEPRDVRRLFSSECVREAGM